MAAAAHAYNNNPEVREGRFPQSYSQPQAICPHCQGHMLQFQPVDRLMTIEAAADLYVVHPTTIRNWIDRGWIRVFKVAPESKILRVAYVDLLRLGERFASRVSITHAKRKSGKQVASPSKAQEAYDLRNESDESK